MHTLWFALEDKQEKNTGVWIEAKVLATVRRSKFPNRVAGQKSILYMILLSAIATSILFTNIRKIDGIDAHWHFFFFVLLLADFASPECVFKFALVSAWYASYLFYY